MPGIPTSRFVSPFPETRDQSSNVIANDFATAKKMAAAAAGITHHYVLLIETN